MTSTVICEEMNEQGVITPVDDGDVGGDVQCGTAWSVRYVPVDNASRAEKRSITITVFASNEFAGEDRSDDARFYDYCVMTESRRFVVKGDDEETINADYQYEYPSINGFETIEQADIEARKVAAQDWRHAMDFDGRAWDSI